MINYLFPETQSLLTQLQVSGATIATLVSITQTGSGDALTVNGIINGGELSADLVIQTQVFS